MRDTKKNLGSVFIMAMGLIVMTGCGQKVGGTYILSQQGQQTQAMNCSQITLNLTSNSNQVQASGSNGTCTEMLSGTDNGNGSIQVTSLTMTNIQSQGYQNGGYQTGAYPSQSYNSQYPSMSNCIFTGMLTISGNTVSGTLVSNAQNGSGYGYSQCGTVQITGTKN